MPRRRRPPRAGALSDLQPLKIAAQILTLQLIFYLASLILFLFTALVAGAPFGADLILGSERVRGDTTQGWVLAFVWVLDGGFVMAIAIVAIIARSKLVPDFALTIQALHLILTTLYSRSLPRNMMWWLCTAAQTAVCIALGMWGCQWRELQPVFFGGGRILGNSAPPPGTTQSGNGDEEEGGERGKGESFEMQERG